jgi:hypothetical protein
MDASWQPWQSVNRRRKVNNFRQLPVSNSAHLPTLYVVHALQYVWTCYLEPQSAFAVYTVCYMASAATSGCAGHPTCCALLGWHDILGTKQRGG